MATHFLTSNWDGVSVDDGKFVEEFEGTPIYSRKPKLPSIPTEVITQPESLTPHFSERSEKFLLGSEQESLYPFITERHDKYIPRLGNNTSLVASYDYSVKFPVIPIYEISREAEDFISRQSKAVRYRKDLITISDKAKEFLKNENIEAKISISLFTDPEYSNWIEAKIRIEVPKQEFRKAYSIYNKLLSYSLIGIRKKTLQKVVVGIESL